MDVDGPGPAANFVLAILAGILYAHDGGAGLKHEKAVEPLTRLFEQGSGALSIQILSEFFAVATRKLGISGQEPQRSSRIWADG
jgi:predicted nucleic acid-binding protein